MSAVDWIGWTAATTICLLLGWWLYGVSDKVSDKAPEWANWIAQDANGSWWYFEHEPSAVGSCYWDGGFGKLGFVRKDAPSPNWRTTLARVTR